MELFLVHEMASLQQSQMSATLLWTPPYFTIFWETKLWLKSDGQSLLYDSSFTHDISFEIKQAFFQWFPRHLKYHQLLLKLIKMHHTYNQD